MVILPNPTTFTFPGLGRPCLRLDGPLVVVLPLLRRVGRPALIGAKGYQWHRCYRLVAKQVS